MAKKAKHSDAVMTAILVTKFKMGQINVKDLEEMLRMLPMGRNVRQRKRCWRR